MVGIATETERGGKSFSLHTEEYSMYVLVVAVPPPATCTSRAYSSQLTPVVMVLGGFVRWGSLKARAPPPHLLLTGGGN